MPSKKDNNANSSSGSGKLTKEEERLLLESSRQVTRTTSALFYGNAFIVSALPLCKQTIRTIVACSSCATLVIIVCACRAVLACADDGPCDILHRVCGPDNTQHMACGLCL